MLNTFLSVVCGLIWLFFVGAKVLASDWSGYLAGELRYFPQSPLAGRQYEDTNLSFATQIEYSHQWDDGYQNFVFVPFIRVDQQDDERTHVDIRELTWLKATQDWELRLGIRKVFWGVAESQHLVDIINQTDWVEQFDGEEKLGQLMLNLALIRDWGTVDLFVLPGFRERTFPSAEGRLLSYGIPIDTDQTRYESAAEEKHVDWAVRWTHTLEDWDIGLSHFSGTGREPQLLPSLDNEGNRVLIPYYEQIQQTGLDVQITKDAILWKLEALSRQTEAGRFTALIGGLEYTFSDVFESGADLGIITEYLFDDRHENATTAFEDDVMVGMRLALNDVQSTELLAGTIVDIDNQSQFYLVETSRRLGSSWKLSLEAYIFSGIPSDDMAYGFRQEDHVQMELTWYF